MTQFSDTMGYMWVLYGLYTDYIWYICGFYGLYIGYLQIEAPQSAWCWWDIGRHWGLEFSDLDHLCWTAMSCRTEDRRLADVHVNWQFQTIYTTTGERFIVTWYTVNCLRKVSREKPYVNSFCLVGINHLQMELPRRNFLWKVSSQPG
jgi:hypothetical protein